MSKQYEVVIAGGGHNGLMVGAYLAKAGVKVGVVERQPYVGGGVSTRELTIPGFKHDVCSIWHGFIQPNPVIKDDELQLKEKFGLKYIVPDQQTTMLYGDDTSLILYRDLDKTCDSIAQFSQHDAEAYRQFHDWSIKTLDLMTEGMYNPPAPFGTFASIMDQSPEGRDVLRVMFKSAMDICDEWFENDKVKMALTREASEGMVAPQTKGTAVALFIFVPLSHKYGAQYPIGGSGKLSEALADCLQHYGGEIMLEKNVKKFKVEGGKTTGVILDDGEEILASKAVVTNFNIKQIPGMLEKSDVPEGFGRAVDNLAFADFQNIHISLALNEAPIYKAGDLGGESMMTLMLPNKMVDYLRYYDNLMYGIPETNYSLQFCETLYDKTRAPEGKHTLYVYHFEPYDLLEGGAKEWDGDTGKKVVDGIMECLDRRCTNMSESNILGMNVINPMDLERYNHAFIKGDFCHIGSHIWQNVGNRPLPEYSNYRLPVKGLYLTGPSAHPGMGVIGGGRATVQVVMEDLGIDFDQVIKK